VRRSWGRIAFSRRGSEINQNINWKSREDNRAGSAKAVGMDGLDNRKISWPIAGNRAGAPSWKRNFSPRGLTLYEKKIRGTKSWGKGWQWNRKKKTRWERDTEKEKGKGLRDEMSDDKVRFFFFIEWHFTVVNNIVLRDTHRREIARRTRDKFDYMNQYKVDPALAGCARRVNERALYSIVDRYY